MSQARGARKPGPEGWSGWPVGGHVPRTMARPPGGGQTQGAPVRCRFLFPRSPARHPGFRYQPLPVEPAPDGSGHKPQPELLPHGGVERRGRQGLLERLREWPAGAPTGTSGHGRPAGARTTTTSGRPGRRSRPGTARSPGSAATLPLHLSDAPPRVVRPEYAVHGLLQPGRPDRRHRRLGPLRDADADGQWTAPFPPDGEHIRTWHLRRDNDWSLPGGGGHVGCPDAPIWPLTTNTDYLSLYAERYLDAAARPTGLSRGTEDDPVSGGNFGGTFPHLGVVWALRAALAAVAGGLAHRRTGAGPAGVSLRRGRSASRLRAPAAEVDPDHSRRPGQLLAVPPEQTAARLRPHR